MYYAGIDIGSRTIELVVVDQKGELVHSIKSSTGFDPIAEARKMIGEVRFDAITATGYGRNLFEIEFDKPTVTEIKAHATAAWTEFPGVTTVLDIGGQDSKVISLTDSGKVQKFEMNDRCAAGTGKFLEIMAESLGYSIDEIGSEALLAEREVSVSSMCTVFAESEVTSLIAKGENRREIARGLHDSVARRSAAMINRVCSNGDVVFTGGVAHNPCVTALLEEKIQRKVVIPEDPQRMGAYGAALLTRQAQIQS